jgi:hypothetical protein
MEERRTIEPNAQQQQRRVKIVEPFERRTCALSPRKFMRGNNPFGERATRCDRHLRMRTTQDMGPIAKCLCDGPHTDRRHRRVEGWHMILRDL